jgi:2-polyprenyl-3-methyl-5-hydroxy-6-metoxy-1,4-benzoquinol methylase
MLIPGDFQERFAEILRKTYMAGWPSVSDRDLADHVSGRYEMFAQNVIPWIEHHSNISSQTWVEVGSGTGSSTLALAEMGAHIVTYEIHEPSIQAAKERLGLLGYGGSATYTGELFGQSCTLTQEGRKVDGVLLAATLEHMTFDECQDVLKASWQALRPGGLLVVVDTPNRLCAFDYHTAHMPFFSMLPAELRLAYANRSPREDFAKDLASPSKQDSEKLTRWGCGISYHEFELSLGCDIHSCVVADGYEREIVRRWPIVWEDEQLRRAFEHYGLCQGIGFTRHNLFLIFRKP